MSLENASDLAYPSAMRDDPAKLEQISADLDALIERRAQDAQHIEELERAERERAESYLRGRTADHREQWLAFYRAQLRSAESARERALERIGKLIDEGAEHA